MSYALLRLTRAYDIFWAQFSLPWKRYQILKKTKHFLYSQEYRRQPENVLYALVQVVDELPAIMKMVRKGTWTDLASGTKTPLSLLDEPEGRRYKRDRLPFTGANKKDASAAKIHHEELMAKVARHPDMEKFVSEQANGTSPHLRPKTWTNRKALYRK